MLDKVCISNGEVKAIINPVGAELIGLYKTNDSNSVIWKGSEWPCSAPWLFPIVGNLPKTQHECSGKTYQMERHGFARKQRFKVKEYSSSSVTLYLNENEETLSQYPFKFGLTITYYLTSFGVEIGVEVTNLDNKIMPFSLGYHPGFVCATDSSIIFEKSQKCYYYGENGFVCFDELKKHPFCDKTLNLNNVDFDDGAIYIKNVDAQVLRLTKSTGDLHFKIPASPYLVIWRKPRAEFICIEPCFGITSPSPDEEVVLSNKAGIEQLGIGQKFFAKYSII